MPSRILIIGAGLTGLATAYYLQKAGYPTTVIEARDRLGGRIYTTRTEAGVPIEMGATWLGKKHSHLIALLDELGIGIKEQYLGDRAIYEPLSTSPPQWVQLPPNDEPSYRIAGGSSHLIETLAEGLPSDIRLGEVVEAIQFEAGQFSVQTNKEIVTADFVVSTLPPKLLVDTIRFAPELPADMRAIAQRTHTWMGESIKVGLAFDRPFWLEPNSGGTIFSNVGPIPEMYDHSDSVSGHFALKGFFNSAFHSLSLEERQAMVLKQLRKYFGDTIDQYSAYEELVWQQEPFTFQSYSEHVLPHQHNGHAIFREPSFEGRFFLGGSETAPQFPGYMDGAVQSAQEISAAIQTMGIGKA